MASFSGLKIGSFLPFVVGLVLTYHVVMLIEGGRAIASGISEEEDLEMERQLNVLNKPPITAMHRKDETEPTRPHKTLMSQIEGPKRTVLIRRTTKEDQVRDEYISSSSNAPGYEYKAGITFQTDGNRFFGARGVTNVWKPRVNAYQSSGAEIAVIAGPAGQTDEIRFGWEVNPKYYVDNVTRLYAYWASTEGIGCRNTLCDGFVQVDLTYSLGMSFHGTSVIEGSQIQITLGIQYEPEHNGLWWLTIGTDETIVKVGYFPSDLFSLLQDGAEYVYRGGRVRADLHGITPEMASGKLPYDRQNGTGYFLDLTVKYEDDDPRYVPLDRVKYTVDCKGLYESIFDAKNNILRYGGPGGGTCA